MFCARAPEARSLCKGFELTLHIETEGDGRSLALLHGWGVHSRVWDGVRSELASRFRVHVVDLPGFGQSPVCAPYTPGEFARELARALPESICVCGWSLGAQLALRWALDFPTQVKRLVLVAATPRFAGDPGWASGVDAPVLHDFASGLRRNVTSTLKRFATLQTHGEKDARQKNAWLCKCLFTTDPEVLQASLQMLLETDLRSELFQLEQPVLLVHGQIDRLVSEASARAFQQLLPRARLEIFEDCAHVPFLSQSKKFVSLVSEFLDE